jgi:hypothetical protein
MATLPMHVSAPGAATEPGRSARGWLQQPWQRARLALRTAFKPLHVAVCPEHDIVGGGATEALWQAFGQWCAEHEGSRVEVYLSSRCVWNALVSGVDDVDAARTQACEQWAHYFGLELADIQTTMCLRACRVPGGVLVLGMPQAVVDGLRAQAESHGVRLQSVSPWWLDALQAWLGSREVKQAVSGGKLDAAGADREVRLHLLEPGVQTCVRALCGAKGPILQGLWVEAVQHGSELNCWQVVLPVAASPSLAWTMDRAALSMPAQLAAGGAR